MNNNSFLLCFIWRNSLMLIPSQRTKIYDAERKCIKKKRRGLSYFACQFSFKTHEINQGLKYLHRTYNMSSSTKRLCSCIWDPDTFLSLSLHHQKINAAIFACCELERSLIPFDENLIDRNHLSYFWLLLSS